MRKASRCRKGWSRATWCTFYHNQMQINGGKNDGFVAWGDSGGMVMGHYGETSKNLGLWQIAREFTLCDNFFMAAFGGSYLNHQFLISGRTPEFFNAAETPAKKKIAVLEDGPQGVRLAVAPDSPKSALDGKPKFVNNGAITPDGYAVNTMAPPYQPSWVRPAPGGDATDGRPAGPSVLPPQTYNTIGDLLSSRGGRLGLVRRRLAGGAGRPRRRHAPELPAPPPALQLLQAVRARHRGARRAPARRRPGRQPDLEQVHRRRGGRQAAGRQLLQAAGQPEPARRLFGHRIGRRPRRQRDRAPEEVAAVEGHGRRHHLRRKRRLVGPRGAAQGRPLGPGFAHPGDRRLAVAKKGAVDHNFYDTTSILRFITRLHGLPLLEGLLISKPSQHQGRHGAC
jgi:hypothetical protein